MSEFARYESGPSSALMSPQTLLRMMSQSGFRGALDESANRIVLDTDKTQLNLRVEDGYVRSVGIDVTFVDDQADPDRICEFLESLGFEDLAA